MGRNITLIGMPAAGKSTVGVLLAKRLGYSFVDVDIVIQNQEGKLLKEIIAERGLDGFLEVENRVNAQLSERESVIAPGGSVIYGKEAMENLKSQGVVVYLKISFEELTRRLGNVVDRGVVLREGMYHQIKRMFAKTGREVLALRRIGIGRVWLDPALGPGGCRELTAEELELLVTTE